MTNLYQTTSICPECLKKLSATVLEDDGAIYLGKHCPEHGAFRIKIDSDARRYRDRLKLYFSAPLKFGELENVHLYLTDRCNLACPMCFTRRSRKAIEPSLKELERFLHGAERLKKVALLGGEPTLRKDIFDILATIRQAGGEAVLCTNGLKLADPGFTRRLAEAGLKEVHLQLDGFNDQIYRRLRGSAMHEQKMQALENLAAAGLNVIILMTVEKSVNDGGIGEMLRFCLSRGEIKGLVVRAAGASGTPGGKDGVDIFPIDLLKLTEVQTAGRIDADDVENFQEIVINLVRRFKTYAPSCFKDRFYVLLRGGGGYSPLGELFDLALIRQALQPASYLAPRFLARLLLRRFGMKQPSAGELYALFKFFLAQISPRRKTGFSGGNRLFVFGIAGLCDRYNYDLRVVDTCTSSLYINNRVYQRLPDGFISSNLD